MTGPVRSASVDDVVPIASMLARAFADDPVASYVFPRDRDRPVKLFRFFEIQLRHVYLPRGEVLTYDDHAAAALMLGPSSSLPPLRDRLGVLGLIPVLGRELGAARRLTRRLAELHPLGPHRYLGTIGTAPERRREGLASALLASALRRCDEERLSCFLEASKEGNVAFYQRFGFVATGSVQLTATIRVVAMSRAPSAPT